MFLLKSTVFDLLIILFGTYNWYNRDLKFVESIDIDNKMKLSLLLLSRTFNSLYPFFSDIVLGFLLKSKPIVLPVTCPNIVVPETMDALLGNAATMKKVTFLKWWVNVYHLYLKKLKKVKNNWIKIY